MQKRGNSGATFTSCARDHDRSAFDVLSFMLFNLSFVQLAGSGRSLLSKNASIILNIAPRPASINLRKTLDTAGQCSITDLVKQSEKRSCKL
ncbi:Calcium-dependent secretion activator [Trichinella pseudospiralis]